MPDAFSGFPAEALGFFKDLQRHNNRDWFLAHKDVYERACRQPMQQLAEALAPRLGPARIPRIYRDVRFSSDKSPYKTHISAGMGRHYVSLSGDGLYVGGGMYMPDSPTLERLRGAIGADASGRQLQRIVAVLKRKRYEIDTHERLQTAPKGFTVAHPRIDLLRMKDIFAGKHFKPSAWLSTPRALDHITTVIRDTEPLTRWLAQHVG
jgi:uncharacterized protein (TIGR02453 family)